MLYPKLYFFFLLFSVFVLHLQITRVKIDQIEPTRPRLRLRLRARTLLEFSSASKNQRGILKFFTKFRYAFRISADSDSVAAALNENHHKSEYSEYDRSKRRISVEALYENRNHRGTGTATVRS
ncbi:hypothetical protein AAHE18_02G126700 [Arachis hypogaea]